MLCHVASSAARIELEPGEVWEKKMGHPEPVWAVNFVTTKHQQRQTMLPFLRQSQGWQSFGEDRFWNVRLSSKW